MRRLGPSALAVLLAAPLSAQMVVSKIRPFGMADSESDGALRQRGMGWCEHGTFVDASVLPERREIRLVCSIYTREGERLEAQVLDADARTVATVPIRSSGTAESPFPHMLWLERGKAEPLPAAWDYWRARVWNEKGEPVDLKVEHGVTGAAALSAKDGGPFLVLANDRGENGLEAYRPDGKRAWATPDLVEARKLEAVRFDGRAALAAWHSIGRVALVDARGKVRERILAEGNSDRLMLDDGKEPRAFVLDSGAGSKREAMRTLERRKTKDGPRWEKTASADLGFVTVTGWTLARFSAGKPVPVVGTSNGWVLLLGEDGTPAYTRKFLSPVRRLTAADLDGDGRDELVVVLDGASQNVVVLSPAAP